MVYTDLAARFARLRRPPLGAAMNDPTGDAHEKKAAPFQDSRFRGLYARAGG